MWREPPDFGTWIPQRDRPHRIADQRATERTPRVTPSLRLAHLEQPRQADELIVVLEQLAALKSS